MDLTERGLAARARRAYELGRLRVAARALLSVGPLVALAVVISSAPARCACLGLGLLSAAVWLRWYGKGFERAATVGVAAGVMPMLAGLGRPWLGSRPELVCGFLCAVGVLGGVLLARGLGQRASGGSVQSAAALAAGAGTAALGCVGAGKEPLLGLVLGATCVLVWSMLRGGKKPA